MVDMVTCYIVSTILGVQEREMCKLILRVDLWELFEERAGGSWKLIREI